VAPCNPLGFVKHIIPNYPSNDPGKKDRILGADRKPWDDKLGVAPHAAKEIVMSLVQRSGKVCSMHMEHVTAETLRPVFDEYLADGAHVMTDSAAALKKSSKDGWKHDRVNHAAKVYVRYENGVAISTNAVEGYFVTLKRGINGVYHHVGKQHLHRYHQGPKASHLAWLPSPSMRPSPKF
jgi:transposase-like protein